MRVEGAIMDKVTQVKQHLRSEHWKKLVSECQSSGMSVRAWCKQNSINEQTYYRNLKKLRQEICESFPVPAKSIEKTPVFKKLDIQTPIPHTKAAVLIHLPVATIEVQNGVDQQTVEAVLLALKTVC